MADYTIPMRGAADQPSLNTEAISKGAPAPASMQTVKPMTPIDWQGSQLQAQQNAVDSTEAQNKIQQQQNEVNDKAVYEAYVASLSGTDEKIKLSHPDGIQDFINASGAKLSQKGLTTVTAKYHKAMSDELEYKTHAVALSDKDNELMLQRLNALVDMNTNAITAYDAARDANKDDTECFNAMKASKQAYMESHKDNPLFKTTAGKAIFQEKDLQTMLAHTRQQTAEAKATQEYQTQLHARTQASEEVARKAKSEEAITEKNQAEAAKLKREAEGGGKGESVLGKAADDLKAGRINQKEYEALKAKETYIAEAKPNYEHKIMKIDGEVRPISFDSKSGKYFDENMKPVTGKIEAVEKGGLNAAQIGTVEKDIFEAKRFLEKTNPKGTTSPWFTDHGDSGTLSRFLKNKLTAKEYQMYDVTANRVANAIVGMQALGRYRGAVMSINEARKLLPAPGDSPETIQAKRDYIEEYTRDSDDELSKLSFNHKRDKIMPAAKTDGVDSANPLLK